MQEEGWVVCRAFQKPTPNQRPFFPSCYAAPAYYDLPNARLHVSALDGDHHFLGSHPAAGSGFPQQYSPEDLESKRHFFSIPPLESPTTLGCAEAGYIAQRSGDGDHELVQQGQPAGAIDWNFLDTLLSTSQLHESSTSSLQ